MNDHVLIIGGGLAGLAAAQALGPRGFRVTLLEARNRLGGRASSFSDATTGQLIDACQHVSMGCCTNLAHFCKTAGIDRFMQPQPTLYFMTPDRRVSRFRADPWPAPLHLLRSFGGAHYLSWGEKLRIAWGLIQLQRHSPGDDPPFLDWLIKQRQGQRAIDRFWGLVLVSALNETPDRIGLKYARKVFVDGFLTHPRGFEVQIPSVPLGELYGAELIGWLQAHNVEIQFQRGARRLRIEGERIGAVEMRQGISSPRPLYSWGEGPGVRGFSVPREGAFPATDADPLTPSPSPPSTGARGVDLLTADWYVSAVPFDRLLDFLPAEVVDRHEAFANLRNLATSPITSVHCWFDRSATGMPHIVLLDSVGQWVFNRGATASGEWYLQVVVSAARQFRGLGHEEVERRVVAELRERLPNLAEARLLRARVVTEHAATFSAVPGVDCWRPGQASPIANLMLAGDWTDTGWPATMEGAVRSGYLAAEAILRKAGRPEKLVQPDLQ